MYISVMTLKQALWDVQRKLLSCVTRNWR